MALHETENFPVAAVPTKACFQPRPSTSASEKVVRLIGGAVSQDRGQNDQWELKVGTMGQERSAQKKSFPFNHDSQEKQKIAVFNEQGFHTLAEAGETRRELPS